MAIITLLTDFGLADGYVAELKGVLVTQARDAVLVDITHLIGPGDLRAAQYLLARTWTRFPKGAVHLAVVDPGVGGSRRALAAESDGHRFVAPDNGILSFLPDAARFVTLAVPDAAAPTFHGRDVFAPAAARLAGGAPLEELGVRITDPYRSPLPTARRDGTAVVGEVLYVDQFGTLVSNIAAERVERGTTIRVGVAAIGPLRRTFADVARGAPVAFIGSGGTVEIAVRDGSAAQLLGVGVGAVVRASVVPSQPTASGP